MAAIVNVNEFLQAIPNARCEETMGMVAGEYLRCGERARMVVLSERGQRLYFMCVECGTHNVDNRGVVLIAVNPEIDGWPQPRGEL